jgi:hypothetical protein
LRDLLLKATLIVFFVRKLCLRVVSVPIDR